MSWEEKSFDELGFIGRGKSRHRPRNDESLYGGKYPMIQTGEVKAANFYINQFETTYNEKGLAQSKLWNKNTLCITIAANIAETAILDIEACFPDSIIGFIADEDKCDVRFIKYFFDVYKVGMQRVSQGATQDNLSLQKLLTFKVPTPPLPTQKKIASILSTYDDLIENNLKRIKLLEEAAQRLYKEWFVDFKFPNHVNTAINPETGLPDGWKRKPISNFIKLIHGCSFKAKEFSDSKDYYLVIRMGNFKENGGLQLNKNVRYLPKYKEIKNKYLLEEGDLLMVLSDVTREGRIIGNVGLIPSNNQKYVLNQRVAKLEINVKNYKTYFYSVLNSENFKEYCRPRANGATVLNLKTKDVTDYNIVIPDSTTLNSFSIKSKRILDNIENLEKQNQNLKEARDLLLPRLMNKTIEV